MKKIVLILIYFISVFLNAQTLHTDDKGVVVFYKIQQTSKSTFCKGNLNKKINIWKVTLGIENGYSESIVPRGVGIADISVYPNPIKPYSHEYCNYKYVKGFEPNSTQRHLDQSLYVWPILNYKIKEIKSGESIINTTYLYLYEGQQPKLTNWEFLGYRLKDDFKVNDPILSDVKAVSTTFAPKVTVIRDDKLKEKEAIVVVPKDLDSIKNISIDKIDVNSLATSEISIDRDRKPIEIIRQESEPKTASIETKEPVLKTTTTDEHIKVVANCPGEKSLEFREKSNASSEKEEQKAYSWLALYYSYVCECESGSQNSDQLVAVINNVVDSFMYNTKGKYGEIPKVEKCKAPVSD